MTQAEIITIGDEILIGQIVDTNSAYISKALNAIGLSVYQITSIQDDAAHIIEALNQAQKNANVIIITGGLGPTKDDITKQTMASFFDDTLVQNNDVLKHITTLFREINKPVLDTNKQQALVPSKAKILHNAYGTAPGLWLQKKNVIVICLPGVPYEMKALMQNAVIPKLKSQFQLPYISHKTLLTYGLGESTIAKRLESVENNLPNHIRLAYLPNAGKVRLRLSSKGFDKALLEAELENQVNAIKAKIEDVFIGFEDQHQELEHQIAKHLTVNNKTLAFAESCTGGKLSEIFTQHSGASAFFKGSVVSYATQTKIDVLGVSEQLIQKHTVVSKAVAEAMATQVKQKLNSDYAIATTGNAGPTQGSSNAAIGTVIIAIATPKRVYSEQFNFGQPREKVITRATHKAMQMLYKEIL